MNGQLEMYVGADPVFFQEPDRARDDTPPFTSTVPGGWRREVEPEWTHLINEAKSLPTQGWKIHVSATPQDAARTLDLVAEVLFRHQVPFKHLTTEGRLLARNSKTTPRQHAGKFITAYPAEDELEGVLSDLEASLVHQNGPYILSDRRWAQAPVYLRYGVFVPRIAEETSQGLVAFLEGEDGARVQDERRPEFHVPEWVKNPAFIDAWLAAEDDEDISLPFTVSGAVKFSTAGGTYRGTYGGAAVIIKEARAHSGHDYVGRSAEERLATEAKALEELRRVQAVPNLRWYGRVWENSFLALDEREGTVLRKWVVGNYPAYMPTTDDFERYFTAASIVAANVVDALDQMHAAGWAHQDVHPDNILVAEDLSISLVDLECAVAVSGAPREHVIAGSGFRTPGTASPAQIDWFGARQVLAFLTVPLIVQSELVADYSFQTRRFLLRQMKRRGLDVPALTPLLTQLEELDGRATTRPASESIAVRAVDGDAWKLQTDDRAPSVAALSGRVVAGLLDARARVGRPNLPVHPHGLAHRDEGLGYGTAGLLTVLLGHDAPVEPALAAFKAELDQELLRRTPQTARLGLFDGITANAWAAFLSDRTDFTLSDAELDRLTSNPGVRLYDGLPGVILALIGIARGERLGSGQTQRVRDLSLTLARDYLDTPGKYAPRGKNRVNKGNQPEHFTSGLLYGHLGIAWLMTRAQALFGDPVFLDAANDAMIEELAGYDYDDVSNTLQLREGNRSIPYLASGSAGFGIVLSEQRESDIDATVVESVPALLNATRPLITVFPGLFEGSAGLAVGRWGMQRFMGAPADHPDELLESLSLYSIRVGDSAVFAGDSGLRVTTDVATGAAGVLHALDLSASAGAGRLLGL